MSNTYDLENKELFKSFLNSTCFKSKDIPYENSLELVVSSVCNTKCTYCYYKNFSHLSHPIEIQKKENILSNLDKVIEWDKLNGYRFNEIDIFSGEFFNLPYYKEILDKLLNNTPYLIVIPTNGTFAFSEEKTEEVSKLLESYRKRIHLSISIDGKYLDNQTRPLRNGKQYNDEFYDRLFKFCKKWNYGFHPMIAANGIEKWKENYIWFIDMIKKYFGEEESIARKRVYLLEVRNPDWTPENLRDLQEFIKFYIQRNWEVDGKNPEKFYKFLRSANLSTRVTGFNSRGLTCSLQTSFSVRLGDLALAPCHRTSYPGYIAGYLKFEGKDLDIDLVNPSVWEYSRCMDFRRGVKCVNCPINEICIGQCLGACLEVNKDPFVPVNQACSLEFAIVNQLIKELDDLGMFNMIIENIKHSDLYKTLEKRNQLKEIRRRIKDGV